MRIAFFDIESSNLNANYGQILSACIKPYEYNCINTFTKTHKSDRTVLQQTIKKLNEYDIIVTWYGRYFDIPFLKTRALIHKLEYGIDPRIKHLDLWTITKQYLKFSNNKLDTVSTDLGFPDKTRISGEIWNNALNGDRDSMKYIVEHNQKDVQVLEKVYVQYLDQKIIRQLNSIPRI